MKIHPSQVGRARPAFTIVELIVVIGIIVLLIAFLVPAIGAARRAAKVAATTTQMRSIEVACESYFTMFNAYPGALSEESYDSGLSFSSSQALLASLTRAYYPFNVSPVVGTDSPIRVTPAYNVSTNPAITPRDYYSSTAYRNYDPFVNPKPAEISSSIGLKLSSQDGVHDIPTFVDSAYGNDALPILYYRAARKYDPSVSFPGGFMQQVTVSSSSSPVGAFYSDTNLYIAQQANAGSPTFKNSGIANLNNPAKLIPLLFNNVNGNVTNGSARGAFVLISAGPDRIYGADPKGAIDDIIVAGGN